MSTALEPPAVTDPAGEPVLRASKVTMRFGGLVAVREVDFEVQKGQIAGLIGPNGAGKTTFFNCLTGLYKPTAGEIRLNGAVLSSKPNLVTRAGVARTFQNIRLFATMTAEENVLVARHARTKAGVFSAIGHGPRFRREEKESRERAAELLSFVGLGRVAGELARNLNYGDQRRLEIARALGTEPTLLLLDEPTAGMNPQETQAAAKLVRAIRDRGISVVVIEHDIRFIFGLCDVVTVLARGEVLSHGVPAVVQADPKVIEAYIGGAADNSDAPATEAAPTDDPNAEQLP